MPPGQNQDELNIGVGLVGIDDLESRLERLNTLLEQTAATADRAFKRPSSSGEELAVRLAELDRHLAQTASRYASFGRAGASSFDQINKQQLTALERIGTLQSKLRDLEERRKSTKTATGLAEITKEAKILEAELDKLIRASYSLQTLDITARVRSRLQTDQPAEVKFSGPASPYTRFADKDMEAALRDIKRMQVQRERLERDYTRHVEQQANIQYKTRTQRFQQYLKDLIQGIRRAEREEAKITSGAGGRYIGRSTRGPVHDILAEFGLGGLSGALGPAAAAAAVVVGLRKVYDVAGLAIERASEQARANRTLSSSAAEAGIQLDVLADKNRKFADATALSIVKATSTSARIAQLATISQRSENIDRLFKGFADLGAARGLDAEGIETVIQQIITGQDEGYKKLLLPNPSQLQARFARQANRTVGSLTAVEKAQIFQNEFLKKADLFNGAAEARLESVDGKAAKLRASFENLANTLSTRFANNYEVSTFIEGITKELTNLNAEIENLASKAERGINIDVDIRRRAGADSLAGPAQFLDVVGLLGGSLLHGVTGGLVNQIFGKDTAYAPFEAGLEQTSNRIVERLTGVDQQKREDYQRQLVNAERRNRAIQRRVAEERQIQLAGEKAEEERLRTQSIEKARILELYKRARTSPEQLEANIRQLDQYASGFTNTVDEIKLQQEVDIRFQARDVSLDFGDPVAAKQRITDQVRKEFQAAVDVSNLPLFDEVQLRELRERGLEELSTSVSKIYNRILSDPNLNVSKLFSALGKIKGDTRLFPEAQEALLNEVEQIRKRFAERTQRAATDYGDLLASFYKARSDNPLLDFFYDAEKAAEDTYRKFLVFGEGFAQMARNMSLAASETKINLEVFSSKIRAAEFSQEASRLQQLQYFQIGGFERRLTGLGGGLDTIVQRQNFLQSSERNLRLALSYNPLNQGPQAQAQQQFQDIYNRILEQSNVFQSIDELARKFGNLGIEGQAEIAKAKLAVIPSTEELLQFINLGGGAFGRIGLFERAELEKTLAKNQEAELRKILVNQQQQDAVIKESREKLRILETEGRTLTERQAREQFLSITGEIPISELPADIRSARVRALNERAQDELAREQEARANLKSITEAVNAIRSKLNAEGLTLSEDSTQIVRVDIGNAVPDKARVTTNSSPANTRNRYK